MLDESQAERKQFQNSPNCVGSDYSSMLLAIGSPIMENTFLRKALLAVVLACPTCAPAQWLNHPDPRTPHARDGKPNLTAPTPRAANGKPDLSGVWQVGIRVRRK